MPAGQGGEGLGPPALTLFPGVRVWPRRRDMGHRARPPHRWGSGVGRKRRPGARHHPHVVATSIVTLLNGGRNVPAGVRHVGVRGWPERERHGDRPGRPGSPLCLQAPR